MDLLQRDLEQLLSIIHFPQDNEQLFIEKKM